MRKRTRRGAAIRHLVCALTLLGSVAPVQADNAPGDTRLAGDYFTGASVFLFQRTVLTAFAPKDTPDPVLDAGAIVWAAETAHDEAGSVALDAITAWLSAADLKTAAAPKDGAPVFAVERLHALACLAYGADPGNQEDLAAHAGVSGDEKPPCVAAFKQAQAQWDGWWQAHRRKPQTVAPPDAAALQLRFAPTADDADQLIADAMRRNGLFQALTDDLNHVLEMPLPMTALLTQCGEPRAFYNPDRGEAVLCYETLGALLQAAPE